MESEGARPGLSPPSRRLLETTASLLLQAREGDRAAVNRLVARYLPALRRWAHGRLPVSARDLADTDDLVQVCLLQTLDQVRAFEPRRPGSFLAYLRRVLQNRILDEIRRSRRGPAREELSDDIPEPGPSPLERTVGREAVAAYEAALARLPEEQQEAVVMRIELGFSYPEIAEALGSPSPNAARMLVSRAVLRLAEGIDEP